MFSGTDLLVTDFGDLDEIPPTAPMTGRLWRIPVGVEGRPLYRGAIR